MSSYRSLLALAFTPLLTIAATCDGPSPVSLDLDDDDRFTPGGRVSFEILPGIANRRDGALVDLLSTPSTADDQSSAQPRIRKVQGTLSIDGSIAHVEGRDTEIIPSGRQAELSVVIPGPAQVRVKADNLRGHVAARGGVRFVDAISLEGIVGLSLDSTEVRIRSGGLSGTDEDLKAGFLFGGRVTLRPIPLFDLYAQGTMSLLYGGVWASDAEVGVDLNVTRNVSVFSGYRWWRYDEDDMAGGSNVDLEFRGPTAGLSLKF